MIHSTPEHHRLEANKRRTAHWLRWGPYLSERQWGTVREDYSASGEAWEGVTHEQARSRAYRWGEDGILGLSDNHQRLCFALSLWNGKDACLKERIFGLTGHQGNHGEDVKEVYFYLDNTPSHSYMKGLYKYPQAQFPYQQLVEENQRRGYQDSAYGLLDTGIFDEARYFDVAVEYAKGSPEDILIQITITNRGPDAHPLHLLPTLWFRNTWSWGRDERRPHIHPLTTGHPPGAGDPVVLEACHPSLGHRWLYGQRSLGQEAEVLFTDNETNDQKLYGVDNQSLYLKDGFHEYIVGNNQSAINPAQTGTKATIHHVLHLAGGETQTLKLRLTDQNKLQDGLGSEFDLIVEKRRSEADDFYASVTPGKLSPELRMVQRQAFAGLLWSKQYYHYVIKEWLDGDPATPPPPQARQQGRNHQWDHLHAEDILSMPDKWEYPWFAAWDLAFHCIPLALVDPEFAKQQLDLMTREWYMHPNGQLPAYEWCFGDVNPPVHAWATWQVYKLERSMTGKGDRQFLERVFQKLLLSFTWWVNRKDADGKNIFQGGFLGLDNIGVFDRSAPLPTGGFIEQADGTSWMGMFCLNMLTISLELAMENPVYEDMATKFFEHFLYIADAMNNIGNTGHQLWDEQDGFYYDVLNLPNGQRLPLKIRSIVGLIPLFAISILEPEVLERLPRFTRRLEWFIEHRPGLKINVACMETRGHKARRLLALTHLTPQHFVAEDRFRRILQRLLDEGEFLSDFGVRSLSRHHADNPYVFHAHGRDYRVAYEPAESRSGLFGGNSNWRGPIWFPVNYLLIESLLEFYRYTGEEFTVEFPAGSGKMLTLQQVATLIASRLTRIFLPGENNHRPMYGTAEPFQTDPAWRDLLLFYEYFHGDDGSGLGANHQTGWTGLIAKLIHEQAK